MQFGLAQVNPHPMISYVTALGFQYRTASVTAYNTSTGNPACVSASPHASAAGASGK